VRPLGHRRLSTAIHPDTGLPTVFVHDGLPGGGGFAERGYEQALAWPERDPGAIAALRVPGRLPVLRPVAEMRQREPTRLDKAAQFACLAYFSATDDG